MNDLNETLKCLQIEDYIWVIYIFLSIIAIISDYYERDYFINHTNLSYKKFHFLNLENGIIIFVIYVYFLYLAYTRYKKQHGYVSLKRDILNDISFIANMLFVIAGLCVIIVELFSRDDENINIVS